ncbi:uncharacterized protein LOC8281225 [Ricinus communis]|uniref:Uncharacterized protein n=1 Tax=Ricinus communis TaxID=3988 RepID=B9RRF3_RICCO|nr:uncharacterized protein LOC8281225 [Ricinus communis]EEF46069.1 conserved hypothetical protein [Ricinus communis]|eukprot:XP_002516322.1 uncharacterized protein LOC8281225 [Ricinus communis]
MEASDCNLFQCHAQVIAKMKTKVGKPPTRLQKKAPSSLQVNYSTIYPRMPSTSSPHTPIPLLSPLIVSPPPLSQEAEEFRFPLICGEIDKGSNDKRIVSPILPGGWQHPAVANGYMEPSSLFNIFQSKCVLVNHAK